MDQGTLVNAGFVLLFILVGGLFAGTELALVSLRTSQVNRLERQGRRGARVAAVARDPNRFLASVQIGVTVAGFFSAAYGASTLAPDFAPALRRTGLHETAAETVALVLLTLVIAYLSLVLGELVPKRIALQRSVAVSLAVGPALDRFASLMTPVVWFLSVSTNAIVRLLGGSPATTSEAMTEEELRDLVAEHESLGDEKRQILEDVFAAGERTLGEVMRPRGEVAFLSAGLSLAEAAELVRREPHARYPVTGESFDDVLGFLRARDLLGRHPEGTVADLTQPILFLPVTNRLLPSLSLMRSQGERIAVVVDEYGGTDGIVTLGDMLEELLGKDRTGYGITEPSAGTDRDNPRSVDAGMTIEEFAETTGIALPDGPYETAAGYVIHRLGRLAVVGDRVRVAGHDLVVTAVVGQRLTRLSPEPPASHRNDPHPGGEQDTAP